MVSANYTLQPAGATFNPPIIVSLAYNESQVPAGFDEADLVIGFWDSSAKQWVALSDCTVNSEQNIITASLSHFSIYSVLAIPSESSAFTVSQLNISPAEIAPGQTVTITSLVANTGSTPGEYEVNLAIDNEIVSTQKVNLPASTGQLVSFTYVPQAAGTYQVTVNSLSGSFTVSLPGSFQSVVLSDLRISPQQASAGQKVEVRARVANLSATGLTYKLNLMLNQMLAESQEITIPASSSTDVIFTVTPKAGGTYTVALENLSGTFNITVPPSLASFSLTGLKVSPLPAKAGEELTISAVISNTGDLPGTFPVEIKMDDRVVQTDTISLDGHTDQELSYTIKADSAGNHLIQFNQLFSETLYTILCL